MQERKSRINNFNYSSEKIKHIAYPIKSKINSQFNKPIKIEKKYDLENFNISFSHRIFLFIFLFAVSAGIYLYSIAELITVSYNNKKDVLRFTIPYLISNLIFLLIFGLFGMKSYLYNLCKIKMPFQMDLALCREKRLFTILFILSTFLMLFSTIIYNCLITNIISAAIQLSCLMLFSTTHLPGGLSGLLTALEYILLEN